VKQLAGPTRGTSAEITGLDQPDPQAAGDGIERAAAARDAVENVGASGVDQEGPFRVVATLDEPNSARAGSHRQRVGHNAVAFKSHAAEQ
jgi:hypothetical protein